MRPTIDAEHRRAADRMYAVQNANIVNTWLVDLHGLHVHESIDKVAEEVAKMSAQSCESRHVCVCCIHCRGLLSVSCHAVGAWP